MPPDFQNICAIPLPCMIVSDDDVLQAMNAPMKTLLPTAQAGRNLWISFRPANLDQLLEDARNGAQPALAQLRLTSPSVMVFQATATRYGKDHILICLQDINETSMAVQMRKDFIADLSHELRSPLTAMQGILETAQGDPEALAYFLPTLCTQVGRMNTLVQDLLALSRIENNERRAPAGHVHLGSLLHSVHTSLTATAHSKGVKINLEMPEEDITFKGDESELTRAIINLAENALRYGKDGKRIDICARLAPPRQLRIDITDYGKGVPAHHLPRLTERFYRADAHRSREEGGHGLGLAIVKHIATHHRGRLLLANRPEGGFQASLLLPIT